MSRGLLIQPNGDYEFREIKDYTDIRAAVGGDFDWTSPGPLTYYCYEYALYERPRNPCATALYADTHPSTKDVLCGPVLAMGPPVNEDDTDVPEEYVELFLKIRQDWGPEAITEMATPLTPEEQTFIQMQVIAAQNKADKAFREGKAVDFGGLKIDTEGEVLDVATTNLLSHLFGEQIDGNRRQGRI